MYSLARNSKDPELLKFTTPSEGEDLSDRDIQLLKRL